MTTKKADSEELLPNGPAAKYIHQSPNTLNGWRSRGIGPCFLKVGNRIFYRRGDLDEWLLSRRVRSTAEARALESHSKPRRLHTEAAAGADA